MRFMHLQPCTCSPVTVTPAVCHPRVVPLQVILHGYPDLLQAPHRSGAGLQSGRRQLHEDCLAAWPYQPGAEARRGVHKVLVNEVLPERAELLEAVLLGNDSRTRVLVNVLRIGSDSLACLVRADLAPWPEECTVEDGCLYVVGGAKRNLRTMKSGSVKPRRRVLPLDIKGREGHGTRYLRLFESGLVKLPQAIRTQIAKCVDAEGKVIGAMKPIGDEFTQQLTRFKNAEGNHVWKSLQKETKGLTANGLRHGYAFRAHKCGEGMDVFTAANLMGHDAKTHIKHYAQWIDETTLEDRVAQWEGVLVSQPESLTKRQQQMQQQQQ